MDTLTAIRSRRTVKTFTGAAIDRATLTTLLEAATWAPTHRLTQPWRFAVLDQAAIAALGGWLQTQPAIRDTPDPAKGAAKLAKLLSHLPKLGAMVYVTSMRDADPEVDREELAAAAAAVQNLLLAATAAGLGSFWSTNPALCHDLTLRWLGGDSAREGVLGAIWLGFPSAGAVPVPPRVPLGERVRWLDAAALAAPR
jgi:nitroreductase